MKQFRIGVGPRKVASGRRNSVEDYFEINWLTELKSGFGRCSMWGEDGNIGLTRGKELL